MKPKKTQPQNLKEEIEQEVKSSKVKRFGKAFVWALKTVIYSVGGALFSIIILGLLAFFSLYLIYSKNFASAQVRSNVTQNVFLDKDDNVIYEGFGAAQPERLPLTEMPEIVKSATLAAEDANFYNHGAIDPKGLTRAAISNIRSSDKPGILKTFDLLEEENYSQGGSTITQQLIKNVYLTNERSFDRKLKEVVYAFELEKKWSKDKIFEEYLNNVYYGEQALGIQNAAEIYFNKNAKDLNLAEASLLAGLPAAPTRLSPISGEYEEAKKRQEYVLSKMYNLGMITMDEAKEAANAPLEFESKTSETVTKAPYFIQYVKEDVIQKIGQETFDMGGLKIHTTLDMKKQEVAENKAAEYIAKNAARKATNAAVVVLDNKEQNIAAMVGGVDWEKSKVNVATAKRQPGSSFKPIVYTSGLLSGYSAATQLIDKAVNFGGIPPYTPKNYDGKYHGILTFRKALANSLNVPTIEVTKLAGVPKVLETARLLGIKSLSEDPNQYGLSIGLGSGEVTLLELTRAYSVYANQGELASFSGLRKVVDYEDNEIYTQPKVTKRVLDEKIAYIMSTILSDNQARSMVFGNNSPLYLKDRRVAAKTGTTEDYADSWTVGFTPQYTVGVWMGNNDHSTMARVSGVEGAAYIWNGVISQIHAGLPAEDFLKPTGLTEMWVNPNTGLPSPKEKQGILEYFVPGTETKKDQDLNYLKQFTK